MRTFIFQSSIRDAYSVLTDAQREFDANGMTSMSKVLAERAYFILDGLGMVSDEVESLVSDLQDAYFAGDDRTFGHCLDGMMDYVIDAGNGLRSSFIRSSHDDRMSILEFCDEYELERGHRSILMDILYTDDAVEEFFPVRELVWAMNYAKDKFSSDWYACYSD